MAHQWIPMAICTPPKWATDVFRSFAPARAQGRNFSLASHLSLGADPLLQVLDCVLAKIWNTGWRGASRSKSVREDFAVTSKKGRTTATSLIYCFKIGAASLGASSVMRTVSQRHQRFR